MVHFSRLIDHALEMHNFLSKVRTFLRHVPFGLLKCRDYVLTVFSNLRWFPQGHLSSRHCMCSCLHMAIQILTANYDMIMVLKYVSKLQSFRKDAQSGENSGPCSVMTLGAQVKLETAAALGSRPSSISLLVPTTFG